MRCYVRAAAPLRCHQTTMLGDLDKRRSSIEQAQSLLAYHGTAITLP